MDFLDQLLTLCANTAPSDLVIAPGRPVHPIVGGRISAAPVMAPDENQLLELFQLGKWLNDASKAVTLGKRRFRVTFFRVGGENRAVMRLLPETLPTPKELRIPSKAIDAVINAESGLFLVNGPTGSGKSTSIASMIAARAVERDDHIVTIERPVEYLLPSRFPLQIQQREVGEDVASFSVGVETALRQKPNMIFIGEINGPDTTVEAWTAALTGHFVVGTIHCGRAILGLDSFLKWMPADRQAQARSLFPFLFRGSLCQRILTASSGDRFAIHELLMPSPAVGNILEKGDIKALEGELVTGARAGHLSFHQSIDAAKGENLITPTVASDLKKSLG